MELTLDTAGEAIGLCLSREGVMVAERIAVTGPRHTAALLPAVAALLEDTGTPREDITAVFVCVGPGGYTALRSGLSAAKALAFGLDVPIVGVGRFEAEAWPHRGYPGPVVAVHHAAGSEYAWQSFEHGAPAGEPAIGPAATLLAAAPREALLAGEVEGLSAESAGYATLSGAAALRRPSVVAELGWRRLQRGESDDPAALSPLYLREPAIGPQKKRGEHQP